MILFLQPKWMNCISILSICFIFISSFAFSKDYKLQKYISGFSLPTYIASAKDGSKRLFIVEQSGLIKVYENGQIKTFLNILIKKVFQLQAAMFTEVKN